MMSIDCAKLVAAVFQMSKLTSLLRLGARHRQ